MVASEPGIRDVAQAFQSFVADLELTNQGRSTLLETLSNGYEGWLKIEFLAWLVTQGLSVNESVGVEYKVALRQQHSKMDVLEKHCDLWIRAVGALPRWHYVELKTPFAGRNGEKLLQSSGYDLWYISRIARVEQPASASVIVLGNGFDELSWKRAESSVERAFGGVAPVSQKLAGQLGKMHWTVWTKWFGDPPPGVDVRR
jgi:hypothetical protein